MSEAHFSRLKAYIPARFEGILFSIKIHSEAAMRDSAHCEFPEAIKDFGSVARILDHYHYEFEANYHPEAPYNKESFETLLQGVLNDLAEDMARNFISECKCNGEHFIKSASPTHYSENEQQESVKEAIDRIREESHQHLTSEQREALRSELKGDRHGK